MLGDKIKAYRTKNRITQKQLAKELGVAQSTIGMIEKNERGASSDLLLKFANFFGVTVDYLLSTEEKLDMAMTTIDSIHNIAKKGLEEFPMEGNTLESLACKFSNVNFSEKEIKEIENYINYILYKKKV